MRRAVVFVIVCEVPIAAWRGRRPTAPARGASALGAPKRRRRSAPTPSPPSSSSSAASSFSPSFAAPVGCGTLSDVSTGPIYLTGFYLSISIFWTTTTVLSPRNGCHVIDPWGAPRHQSVRARSAEVPYPSVRAGADDPAMATIEDGVMSTPRSIPRGASSSDGPAPSVWWIYNDLRVFDNPALRAADCNGTRAVVPVFVWSPEEEEAAAGSPEVGARETALAVPGGAARLWLHHALRSLDEDLRSSYGSRVVFVRGPYVAALAEVCRAVGATEVHHSRRYEPAQAAVDAAVADSLAAVHGITLRAHAGFLIREVADVRVDMRKWVGHFGTLTPFSRACAALGSVPPPLPRPDTLRMPPTNRSTYPGEVPLNALGLARMPVRRLDGSTIDWGSEVVAAWGGSEGCSEATALALWRRFLDVARGGGLGSYEARRHLADGSGVARVSPYLRFGQLSARFCHRTLAAADAARVSKTFNRRVVWRDLAYWQLRHFPRMPEVPIRAHYEGMRWSTGAVRRDSGGAGWGGGFAGRRGLTGGNDGEQSESDDPFSMTDDVFWDGETGSPLERWEQGRTGYPLVDAGMRELRRTGWMQQSVRMVCAAFLTEYLNIHWVHGAKWFHDNLVDADLAINSMMVSETRGARARARSIETPGVTR